MKEKGIVRNIDPLGRLVIPKEVRKEIGFDLGEPVEIITVKDNEESYVILKRYKHSCMLCGEMITDLNKVIIINGKNVCEKCQEKISSKK